MSDLVKFRSLGLSETTLKALAEKGFEEPTPIQEKTIPLFLKGENDIIGQAQTGTGKTAAFGLPLIEMIEEGAKSVQALILTPTRELAIQVSEEINSFKGKKKMQIVPIYGGQSMDEQIRRLRKGVDIVVGTPGRIIDHL
ncbi:MAG: DEAD/DEAH box helicase, partial [Bacteroidota bacterium]|nr:DEAD/DEAH box helicase [Bacteroidota bacterium]